MTSDVTELRYWIDIAIKMAIGVLVSIIGLDYRSVKNSLQELQDNRYRVSVEVQVLQSELNNIKMRLDRIEGKLDRVLSK
jgi:predicted nuclease with TOPRIM domain